MSEWLDVDPLFDYMCNCSLSYAAVGEQMKQCTGEMATLATEDLMVDGDDEDQENEDNDGEDDGDDDADGIMADGRLGGQTDGWDRRIDARPMTSKMRTTRVTTMTTAEDDGDGDSECGDDDGRWRRRRGQ